ncbi:MAG: hypothetical protein QOI74_3066 [Micromonosporaceae bacterium]|nr:hypothetical protein [Micromonosporaceae bacterium]
MRAGDAIPELRVTPDRYLTVRYAGASGDFNPIHIDEDFARQVGLPGRILHGLWTMAQVARAQTAAGGGPHSLRRLQVQFRGMGLPEHEVTVTGTVAEVRDGRYTGRLVGDLMHGPAKAAAITGLATLEGLDLARCAAYSDSINDIPMLSAVGHAVAVNPDAALRSEARRRGWEIRDFRTGRKAAKVAVPAAMGTAVAAGAVVAGVALARRRRGTHERHVIASLLSR